MRLALVSRASCPALHSFSPFSSTSLLLVCLFRHGIPSHLPPLLLWLHSKTAGVPGPHKCRGKASTCEALGTKHHLGQGLHSSQRTRLAGAVCQLLLAGDEHLPRGRAAAPAPRPHLTCAVILAVAAAAATAAAGGSPPGVAGVRSGIGGVTALPTRRY